MVRGHGSPDPAPQYTPSMHLHAPSILHPWGQRLYSFPRSPDAPRGSLSMESEVMCLQLLSLYVPLYHTDQSTRALRTTPSSHHHQVSLWLNVQQNLAEPKPAKSEGISNTNAMLAGWKCSGRLSGWTNFRCTNPRANWEVTGKAGMVCSSGGSHRNSPQVGANRMKL